MIQLAGTRKATFKEWFIRLLKESLDIGTKFRIPTSNGQKMVLLDALSNGDEEIEARKEIFLSDARFMCSSLPLFLQ